MLRKKGEKQSNNGWKIVMRRRSWRHTTRYSHTRRVMRRRVAARRALRIQGNTCRQRRRVACTPTSSCALPRRRPSTAWRRHEKRRRDAVVRRRRSVTAKQGGVTTTTTSTTSGRGQARHEQNASFLGVASLSGFQSPRRIRFVHDSSGFSLKASPSSRAPSSAALVSSQLVPLSLSILHRLFLCHSYFLAFLSFSLNITFLFSDHSRPLRDFCLFFRNN